MPSFEQAVLALLEQRHRATIHMSAEAAAQAHAETIEVLSSAVATSCALATAGDAGAMSTLMEGTINYIVEQAAQASKALKGDASS